MEWGKYRKLGRENQSARGKSRIDRRLKEYYDFIQCKSLQGAA
jgi:hypothetical protein